MYLALQTCGSHILRPSLMSSTLTDEGLTELLVFESVWRKIFEELSRFSVVALLSCGPGVPASKSWNVTPADREHR